MMSYVTLFLTATVLCLLQLLAAVPWLAAFDWETFKKVIRVPLTWVLAIGLLLISALGLAVFMKFIGSPDRLAIYGRLFASILQIQLSVDFFLLVFTVLLVVWPKGAAVAQAAFREGLRQPMFWLLIVIAEFLLGVSLLLPYFTFGDDYKMMKSIGYDVLMLVAMLFSILAAGLSITDEIEGRTAVTLMSKPITRRSFLFGKFAGILLCSMAMLFILSWTLNWILLARPYFDKMDQVDDPLQSQVHEWLIPQVKKIAPSGESSGFVNGMGAWTGDALAQLPGVVVGFGQIMVMLAIAVALATRLPLIVNLLACLAMFLAGNVAPVLVQRSRELIFQHKQVNPGSTPTLDLISFVAQLFDNILPALNLFNLSAAIVRDLPLPVGQFLLYVGSVLAYAVLYTGIALLVGLILFEDRDLA